MSLFTGGSADDVITPAFVSSTVVTDGAARPGDGADTIIGGAGADTLDGGGGDDLIVGGQGADLLKGSGGADTFVWNPGDGSDSVDGGSGVDTLQFNTANIAETIGLAAGPGSGGHVLLTRDVGAITLDLDNVEHVAIAGGGGGADTFNLGNLAGTDVMQVDIDLGLQTGGNDGQVDKVVTGGGPLNNRFVVTAGAAGTTVTGVGVGLTISHAETVDRLVLNGLDGADTLDASHLAGGIGVSFDGGAGTDAVLLNGSSGADTLTLAGVPTAGVDSIDFSLNGASGHLDLTNVETLSVDAGGGDDVVSAASLSAGAAVRLGGGDGADTLTGSRGADTVDGGAGDDLIFGGQGADLLKGGGGADTIVWNPGDGSDSVDGGSGFDTLQFNTSNVGEIIGLSASNGHAILTRDVAAITLDLDNVEHVAFSGGGGGVDTFNIGDLSSTDVRQVDIDLGLNTGGNDGLVDRVVAAGKATNDRFVATAGAGGTSVTGVGVGLTISHAEAVDRLVLNGLDGNDTLDASHLAGGVGVSFDGGAGVDAVVLNGSASADILTLSGVPTAGVDSIDFGVNGAFGHLDLTNVETLSVDAGAGDDVVSAASLSAGTAVRLGGGDGSDTLTGSHGADTVDGGSGDDLISGGQGGDLLKGGAGADTIVWNPGDGSDTVDGGSGADTLQFNDSNVSEVVGLSAAGDGHAMLTRNVGAIAMDLNNVEHVAFGGGSGGTDTFDIGDLAATDVKQVDIDLGAQGVSDGLIDTVTLAGQSRTEHVTLASAGGVITVTGLAAGVAVSHADEFDRLFLNVGGGNDVVDASGLGDVIRLTIVGGDGNDNIQGGQGDDALTGDGGADTLAGNGGNDVMAGGDGSDRFVFTAGQGGRDEIVDFRAHAPGVEGDLIVLSGFSDHSFDQAVANGHIVQSGTSVLVGDASGTIVTLDNVSLGSLHASDFLFG